MKKLEPNFEEIYDFGGGRFSPFKNNAVIIDAFDIPKMETQIIEFMIFLRFFKKS
jgi:hypothetical protein